MKKLFEHIFKNESKLNYESSITADGYAGDLRIICSHFDLLFMKCDGCKNHPGFYHRSCGKSIWHAEDFRDTKKVTDVLIDVIASTCDVMIGGNVNMKARTIDRTVNMQLTKNIIKNIIPCLCDQDLLRYSKTEDIVIFFCWYL
jgi:hypothetical protein